MKGFVMSWDAHIVIAVLWHHPGSAGERCGGLYCCLPPFVPGVTGQPHFLLTLVTPNCAGRIPLERGPWKVLGKLGKRRWGSSSTRCPKLGTGKRLAGHTGAGWTAVLFHPHLGEAGCHLEMNTGGRLPWQQAAWQSLSL